MQPGGIATLKLTLLLTETVMVPPSELTSKDLGLTDRRSAKPCETVTCAEADPQVILIVTNRDLSVSFLAAVTVTVWVSFVPEAGEMLYQEAFPSSVTDAVHVPDAVKLICTLPPAGSIDRLEDDRVMRSSVPVFVPEFVPASGLGSGRSMDGFEHDAASSTVQIHRKTERRIWHTLSVCLWL